MQGRPLMTREEVEMCGRLRLPIRSPEGYRPDGCQPKDEAPYREPTPTRKEREAYRLGHRLSYTVYMRTTTLTIRTDEALREALQKRAELQGKTLSEVAREILADAVAERPLGERVGHLRGQLHREPGESDPWREQIRERNWRR